MGTITELEGAIDRPFDGEEWQLQVMPEPAIIAEARVKTARIEISRKSPDAHGNISGIIRPPGQPYTERSSILWRAVKREAAAPATFSRRRPRLSPRCRRAGRPCQANEPSISCSQAWLPGGASGNARLMARHGTACAAWIKQRRPGCSDRKRLLLVDRLLAHLAVPGALHT